MIHVLTLAVSALLIAGCMSQRPAPAVDRGASASARATAQATGGPGYYTVKKGDTLYRIALEHGQDYRDVVAWNSIANPNSIKEGQILRVAPPVAAAATSGGPVAQPVSPPRWSNRGRWMSLADPQIHRLQFPPRV